MALRAFGDWNPGQSSCCGKRALHSLGSGAPQVPERLGVKVPVMTVPPHKPFYEASVDEVCRVTTSVV